MDRESAWWAEGRAFVAGVDEVGRGAWAGPVVAAAVVLPARAEIVDRLAGVQDSKALSPAERRRLAGVVARYAVACAIGVASSEHVDYHGVVSATARAMDEALHGLAITPDGILIDGLPLRGLRLPHSAVVKGDARCLSIAAASIVAKVTRDRLMAGCEATHPGYGFAAHKGYGTAAHRDALCRLGPCPEHRLTYAPVAAIMAQSWA